MAHVRLASGCWKSRQNYFHTDIFCFQKTLTSDALYEITTRNKQTIYSTIDIIIILLNTKFLSSKHDNSSSCCSTCKCTRVCAKNYLLFSKGARFWHLIWNNNSPQTNNVPLSYTCRYRCMCWCYRQIVTLAVRPHLPQTTTPNTDCMCL